MPKKQLFEFKTYELLHGANHAKEQQLWQLYSVYKKEYKTHIHNYWQAFLQNKLIKFSHLGSTKHITTQLNSAYLQIVLSQACATLNQYIAAVEQKFNLFISSSSIKDKETLHQLRTINSSHSWLNRNNCYYPVYQHTVIDDFGNEINTFTISSVMNDYGFSYTVKRKTEISTDIINDIKKDIF